MKRYLRYICFVLIVGGLMSCSDKGEDVQPRVPLAFSASDDVPTRGTPYESSWSTTEGSAFSVVAYHYAPNSNIAVQLMDNTVSHNGTAWGYEPVVYWPAEGTADFFSYAPACEGARKEFLRFTPNHTDYQAILVDCHVPESQITTIHSLGTNSVPITAYPHDAADQYDLMFSYLRDQQCAEQAVTDVVHLHFVHVMAGVNIKVDKLIPVSPSDPSKIPAGTAKIVVGIGRVRTGGTLAICESDGDFPDVTWTLDGREGTFYETYNVTWTDGHVTAILRDETGKPAGMTSPDWRNAATFFFPPQRFESGLTIMAYFYDSANRRIGYHAQTLPYSETDPSAISKLERGKILTLNIQ